jgi:hypothetical protein
MGHMPVDSEWNFERETSSRLVMFGNSFRKLSLILVKSSSHPQHRTAPLERSDSPRLFSGPTCPKLDVQEHALSQLTYALNSLLHGFGPWQV